MISYETYCKLRALHEQEKLKVSQIAQAMKLDPRTVGKWLRADQYQLRKTFGRGSVLDPFKGQIVRWCDAHPYSAVQVLQRLRELGYTGSYTTLKDYLRTIRKAPVKAFVPLHFTPGEAAQVDWGEYGTVQVGSTRRRLSFFVMVLCYSRLMYLEFTVSQTMEHFLACHQHAFERFGGVPGKIMVDNLKSAVLQRLAGTAPVFNAHYLDLARHYGFTIAPCNPGKGNEKGRVENGVGYVKKNLLNGLEIGEFSMMNPIAQHWLETVANVRIHAETRERPCDRFAQEQAALKPRHPMPYDCGQVLTQRVSSLFRVRLDTNRYSVPAEHAGARVTIKAYPDRICVYRQEKLIARHARSFDRHQDFEDPDHPKALLAQRRNAREQRLIMRFLALSKHATAYYQGLEERQLNPRHHVAKILALSDIYDQEAIERALEDAITFQAFHSDYILNLLQSRAKALPDTSPLQVTRRQDLLELELDPPDLSLYEVDDHDDE